MRALGLIVGLTAIWVMLWGAASPANVLSGIGVVLLLIAVVPGTVRRRGHGRVRLGALLRLVTHVLVNVVRSNATVARDTVSRPGRLYPGVVGVRLPDCSDELVTLITNLLALTPGLMPLTLLEAPRTLYVHALHLRDEERVKNDVRHLTALAVRAFGSDADIAELERPRRRVG